MERERRALHVRWTKVSPLLVQLRRLLGRAQACRAAYLLDSKLGGGSVSSNRSSSYSGSSRSASPLQAAAHPEETDALRWRGQTLLVLLRSASSRAPPPLSHSSALASARRSRHWTLASAPESSLLDHHRLLVLLADSISVLVGCHTAFSSTVTQAETSKPEVAPCPAPPPSLGPQVQVQYRDGFLGSSVICNPYTE